jgi:hypothetical protein
LRERKEGEKRQARERERERGWVLMARVHRTIVIIYFVKAKSKVAWISAADCTSDTTFLGLFCSDIKNL